MRVKSARGKERLKKVTVTVPADVLRRAMKASGQGFSATVRMALEAVVDQDLATKRLIARAKRTQRGASQAGGEQ